MPKPITSPKFKAIRILSKIHGYIYRISRGKIGQQLGTVKFLMLTTTGNKTRKKRSVPLASIPYGSDYILVASFGGSPVDPAWVMNIRQNPAVEIGVGLTRYQAKATIIETTDSRYEDMWVKATTIFEGFNNYRRATSRHIHIVLITRDVC